MTESAPERKKQEASQEPEEYPPIRESGYWGSVRFFKHLILAVLALAILVPTTLSIVFGLPLGRAKNELWQLQQSVSQQPPASSQAAYASQTAMISRVSPSQTELVQTAKRGGQEAGLPQAEEDPSRPQEEPSGVQEDPGVELPAYQKLYPELYAKPHKRNSIDREKTVYLTFDDGPSARTPELLAILEEHGIKATFFVVAQESEEADQWMRDIVAAGHTLGLHSYSHDCSKIYESVETYLADFNAIYTKILAATGTAPQIFRFPGGSINTYNGATYQEIISEMVRRGFVYFDWNRMTGDAVQGSVPVQTLVNNALDRPHNARRLILLMHDSARFTNTVEALPQIIAGYREAGFSFAALTPEVKPIVYGYPE